MVAQVVDCAFIEAAASNGPRPFSVPEVMRTFGAPGVNTFEGAHVYAKEHSEARCTSILASTPAGLEETKA